MKLIYVSESELDRLYESGSLSKVYWPDQEDLPSDFAETELEQAQNLEKIVASRITKGDLEAYYDSWSDKTLRATISSSLICDLFIDLCIEVIRNDEGRCIMCVVVGDLSSGDYSYHGRVALTADHIFIEDTLAELWRSRITHYLS